MTGGAPARTLVVDFDGTITEEDSLDAIAQEFGDPAVYREVDEGLDAGTITLRECIVREYAPVRAPLAEVVTWVLERVRIRPGFRELVELARTEGWGFVVLSSGFHELIEPVLEWAGVDVEVRANRVETRPDGWVVHWRDETVCTECGQACKRSALPDGGELVYVGDGISDRCAALASDRIFAIRGLARYLDELGVAYERFDDFLDIAAALRA